LFTLPHDATYKGVIISRHYVPYRPDKLDRVGGLSSGEQYRTVQDFRDVIPCRLVNRNRRFESSKLFNHTVFFKELRTEYREYPTNISRLY